MPPAASDDVQVTLSRWQAAFLRWHLLAYSNPGSPGREIRDLIPEEDKTPMPNGDGYLTIAPHGHHTQRIHPSAVIGHPPEVRGWQPGDPAIAPEIHETARINALVSVDAGTMRATRVGPRSWLMKHVHLGHDAIVGEDCEIAPGAVLCGHVELGDRVKVGVNATILPYRTVGDDVTIGSGAVVTKDLPDGVTVVGNPARVIDRNPVPHTARLAEQRTA